MNTKINNMFSKKAGISYLQILLLVLYIFAFSWIFYQTTALVEEKKTERKVNEEIENEIEGKESNVGKIITSFISEWWKRSRINPVSAKESLVCCPKTEDGAICQNVPNDYEECEEELIDTECDETSNCESGTCFDPEQGLCSSGSTKQECEDDNGEWFQDESGNIEECQRGCCLLGSEAQFITESRCEYLHDHRGFSDFEFKPNISNELECLAEAERQKSGACVIEGNEGNDCEFLTERECLEKTDSSENFNEDELCTNPELDTVCEKTEETTCLEDEDEVYFVDSCGNIANIYDSSKVDSEEYWSEKISKEDSCNPEGDNAGSSSCGNCNYLTGSTCGEDEDDIADYGDYVCKDLDCKDAPSNVDAEGNVLSRKDRKNGESWCVYDSTIDKGRDTVGSRHWKYYCRDGEVEIEPCQDYRGEICVENEAEGEDTISQASCRINRANECLKYNEEDEGKMKGKCNDNSDCYVQNLDFDSDHKFSMCVPRYPGGFSFNSEKSQEANKKTCNMADFTCTKVEVKDWKGSWNCEAGCDCDSREYTQQMNDLCRSLGDCGGYVNIIGDKDKGYTSDANDISLSQYDKFIKPKEEQSAEPGDISEIFEGQVGGEYDPNKTGIGMGAIYGGIPGALGGLVAVLLSTKGSASFMGLGTSNIPVVVKGEVAKLSFISDPTIGTYVQGIGNAALGAIGGAVAGHLVSNVFGLEGGAANAAVIGGAVAGAVGGVLSISGVSSGLGIGAGSFATSIAGSVASSVGMGAIGSSLGALAAGGVFGLIAAVIIALYATLIGWGDTKETEYNFKCHPWQAPTGGEKCERYDGGKWKPTTGSEYRCESLGQGCELINEGTEEEDCIWENRDDVTPPKISFWEEALSENYTYEETSKGVKIREKNGDCIEANSYLEFGIEADEPAQCKYSTEREDFDEMDKYFGEDNLYMDEHTTNYFLPHPGEIAYKGNSTYEYVLDKIGEQKLYVSCQDSNGNKRDDPYVIDMCIAPGSDLTPPNIIEFVDNTKGYIKHNQSNQTVWAIVNEPAECRWDREDKEYDNMNGSMNCTTGIEEMGSKGWGCSTNIELKNDSEFYFRCKDQPWIDDENYTGEEERNVNQDGFKYELEKSEEELDITSIKPKDGKEIIRGTEPTTVELEVETEGGIDNGESECSFKFDENHSWTRFKNTFSNSHKQVFSSMLSGEHGIDIMCEDEAGNEVENRTEFSLELDTTPPHVTRAYYDGKLNIMTNENSRCSYSKDNCRFRMENGTEMTGMQKEHTASIESEETYYIKCKDKWGNKPDGCSIIIGS